MPLERWDWCSNKIFHNRQCCWFHFEQEMYAPATSGRLAHVLCKSLYRNCYREYTPSQASRCWVYLKSALSDRFHCINSLYYYYSYSVWKQLTISLLGMYSTSTILLATLAVNRHRRKERQYNMILLSSGSVTVYPLRKWIDGRYWKHRRWHARHLLRRRWSN